MIRLNKMKCRQCKWCDKIHDKDGEENKWYGYCSNPKRKKKFRQVLLNDLCCGKFEGRE